MNKKEEEIQRKLLELESSVLSEKSENTDLTISTGAGRTDLMTTGKKKGQSTGGDALTRSDGAYFGGLALIFLGIVLVFQHITVTPGLLSLLGLGGGGFLILFLPLMIGIGMMMFNSRNKWGWITTAGSCVLLIFAVLSGLNMVMKSMSLLQLIVLFLPFAVGGSLLVKGMGGVKGVIKAVREQIPEKE